MDKIAVLIPCYNEGQTIAKVVKDYREALPEATIYVYDNNSSDHTDEIAREAGAVVRYEYQQGKGNVIRSMFRDIDAECYVMTDGDDTRRRTRESWQTRFYREKRIWSSETAFLRRILPKISVRSTIREIVWCVGLST